MRVPLPYYRQPLSVNRRKQLVSDGASIVAPTGGWDAVSSLADMPPDRAQVLDNWFPKNDSVEMRRGYKTHASGMTATVVDSLMPYQAVTSAGAKLFAATGGDFYDVTSEATASTTSSISGQTNNRWQHINFTTSGGKYLWCCNGADVPQMYDGTSWATASVSGVTMTDIVHVNAHKERIWMVLKDSTKAAYLAANAVTGAATTFELGNQFTKGGYLVAMTTWTRDGGAGEDDFAVFISSRGQVALYQGTDPASAVTWGRVGVFDLGAPIGRRCFTKVAGDVALINVDGVLPLSKALGQDRGAAAAIALTKNINNAMNTAARLYASNFGWELMPFAKGTMALLNVPLTEGSVQHQYVINTLTGAWCRFTGWNVNCLAVFNDNLYGGSNDGKVLRLDFGGRDGTDQIEASGQGAYNYLGTRGILKNFGQVRALVQTDSDLRPAVGISTDFRDNAVLGTPTTSVVQAALYDVAQYDVDTYAIEDRSIMDWTAVNGEGYCAAIHFRASKNTVGETSVHIHGFDMTYTKGAPF